MCEWIVQILKDCNGRRDFIKFFNFIHTSMKKLQNTVYIKYEHLTFIGNGYIFCGTCNKRMNNCKYIIMMKHIFI